MFRSPSEPSPFSSIRCPYKTQARCGRPYCPFAHQADNTVDVVEANDVLVLDSDQLSDGGRSSVATEIRQENPTGFSPQVQQQQRPKRDGVLIFDCAPREHWH
ncbi:hypothetical protein niasHT_002367 [Heterodera trifolii]|uniref:C3H1-type domain-containing protein n=1 Tax=Heterodera trifolii TaxID=157864 RepID=A0ABD2LMA0_9BILA